MHASSQPGMLRSVVAVLAGALTGIILSIATDSLLRAIGILPAPGQPASSPVLFAATLYRTVYGVLGAYLTARIAPSRPMLHVTILGSLGLLASLAGAIATWNKVDIYGPRWYPLALVVLALPTAWFGGKLHKPRQSEPGVPS
jgi:hypothetical protein